MPRFIDNKELVGFVLQEILDLSVAGFQPANEVVPPLNHEN
jgi:hypothetical protein